MIIAVIPAKGKSGRLPNKNMSPILGRPMLDYTIEEARRSERVSAIFVSTDSDEIADHAAQQGVAVIRRPEALGGETPIIDVYRHAVAELKDPSIAVVVGLQADHPDRDVTIDESIEVYETKGADHLVSLEADGTKNGAHYILARSVIDGAEPQNVVKIVDDCTNVHFQADLEKAAERLKARI